jgi:hypothetical protein
MTLTKKMTIHGLAAIALISAGSTHASAQSMHTMPHDAATTTTTDPGALIKIVRQATERFKNVNQAIAEGYVLQFGCVSGDYSAAMGMHYVNGDLINKGILDPTKPQIIIYEPQPDGTLQLIGADFLVLAAQWNTNHTSPPELMGQFFHLFDAPNRFGLPPFYTLHVWAWKDNPNGAFVNWHPNVSCQSFAGSN